MKTPNRVVANRKRGAHQIQSKRSNARQRQQGEPGQQATASGGRGEEAELAEIMVQINKIEQDLAGLVSRIMNLTPVAFEADQDGILAASRKLFVHADFIRREFRSSIAINRIERIQRIQHQTKPLRTPARIGKGVARIVAEPLKDRPDDDWAAALKAVRSAPAGKGGAQ